MQSKHATVGRIAAWIARRDRPGEFATSSAIIEYARGTPYRSARRTPASLLRNAIGGKAIRRSAYVLGLIYAHSTSVGVSDGRTTAALYAVL